MSTIAAEDLMNRLAETLDRVAAGERFEVVANGVVVARIVPANSFASGARSRDAVRGLDTFPRGCTLAHGEVADMVREGRRFG